MKKLLFILLSLLIVDGIQAQSDSAPTEVSFQFQPGSIGEGNLKTLMEQSVSRLLSAINGSCLAGSSLNLSSVAIEPGALSNIESLWSNIHFYCEDAFCVEPCLTDAQGYQVRSLPITLVPLSDDFEGSTNRELTVSFNQSGRITGVRMALEDNQFRNVMQQGSAVSDTRRRLEILKFVEDFRCYYNEKNLAALEKIYSDDALIITGSVIKNREMGLMPTVKYRKQDKAQYMQSLKGIFARNKYIDIKFDKISVVRHGTKPDFYGVTLHQDWNTSTYSDEGWLFLLWDFRDEQNPVIHVRTWQPNQIVKTDTDVFSLDDFFIP